MFPVWTTLTAKLSRLQVLPWPSLIETAEGHTVLEDSSLCERLAGQLSFVRRCALWPSSAAVNMERWLKTTALQLALGSF
jgi:hypothetical protein